MDYACIVFSNEDRENYRKIKINGNFKKKKRQMLESHRKHNLEDTGPSAEKTARNSDAEIIENIYDNIVINSIINNDNKDYEPNVSTFENNPPCEFVKCDSHDLSQDLRVWAVKHQIKHTALNDLMKIIIKNNTNYELPTDARTLLKTPRSNNIVNYTNGAYWHYGLKNVLIDVLSGEENSILLNINIDGLPMFKSSSMSFWPILININEIPHLPPLIVGIYSGICKFFLKSNRINIKYLKILKLNFSL